MDYELRKPQRDLDEFNRELGPGREMVGEPTTATHYRASAAELRHEAKGIATLSARVAMLSLADNYDQLARAIEDRANAPKS